VYRSDLVDPVRALAGVISNVQASGHAVSITDDHGVQVLMHIGLDTVNLAGQGFTHSGRRGTAGCSRAGADRSLMPITLHDMRAV
jgi:phosphotransferase system IIA component